jgi:hypothetical protein
MSTRIYLVTDKDINKHRLIRAGNQEQAICHAAKTRFDIDVACQDDLVSMISHGIPVEVAGGPTMDDLFEDFALFNSGKTDL